MLLPHVPLTSVYSTVGPLKLTKAVLFVVFVPTTILPAILPRKRSDPMHLILLPHALIPPLVIPNINALSINIIVFELSHVARVVDPFEQANTIFHTVGELALEMSAIGP